jgi:hypothetical protein
MRPSQGFLVAALLLSAGPASAQFDIFRRKPKAPAEAATLDLTEKQGPWMIRVVSFTEGQFDVRDSLGKTVQAKPADEVARQLAQELREHRIDAWVYEHNPNPSNLGWNDQQAVEFEKQFQVKPRRFRLKNPGKLNYLVIAGSFDAPDSPKAKRMLEQIRAFRPKMQVSMWDAEVFEQGIADGPRDKAVVKPFGSAMMVVNPLRKEESAAAQAMDVATMRLLVRLNDDEKFGIWRNQQTYTIMVKMFAGANTVAGRNAKQNAFDRGLEAVNDRKPKDAVLVNAGKNAIAVTDELRRMGHEAYVFHGQYASIVCIGGYSSEKDPQLKVDLGRFAKLKVGELSLDEPKVIAVPRRPPVEGDMKAQ